MVSRVVLIVAVALALGLKQTCSIYHWDQDSNESSPQLISWLLDNKFSTIKGQLLADLQNVELETVTMNNRDSATNFYQRSSCQLVQIVHLLYKNGCQPKAIASFACAGSCPSYIQISTSKFWQHERSCSCCQHTSLQEATFTLDCPSLDPPYRKVGLIIFELIHATHSRKDDDFVELMATASSLHSPQKVKTYSPVDCMCRACTDLGKEKIQPQELVEALDRQNGGDGAKLDERL